MDYSASMVSCLFWFQETRKTAELIHDGLTLQQIRERAVTDNLYQVRSPARATRIASISFKRLAAMDQSLRSQFMTADIKTAKLILLLAIMKTDLLFYEFMLSVFKQIIVLGGKALTDSAISMFFDKKIAESPEVAAFSEVAIRKLKQIYVKLLVDAGVISSSKDRVILLPMIDYRLHEAVTKVKMLPYLAALTGEDSDE